MGLGGLMLLLGIGFLIADLHALLDHIRYWRRRPRALLTWRAPRPPLFALQIGIGVALGLLLLHGLFIRPAPPEYLFGQGMMFLYYGYVVPTATRLERGFYEDGVWCDRGYVPYRRIGGIGWREEDPPTLLLAAREGGTARRVVVPGPMLGAVRRLLRDLMGSHTITLDDSGLHLGLRDDRENV